MTAADTEERAELEVLRERADATGREAARTLAELATRLAAARDPGAVARRLSARASQRVRAAAKALKDNGTARRAAVAAVPALGVLTVAVMAHRRGWLSINSLIPNERVLRHKRLPAPATGRA